MSQPLRARLSPDDANACTFIESAGGGSIIHHITSYGGWDPVPFQRAFTLSAGWVPVTTDQQQVDSAKHFLDYLNVTTIQEAQEASTESAILANAMAIRAAPWSTFRYGPVVDSLYVPDHPSILLHDGDFRADVSVMTGHVMDESSLFTPPFVKTDQDLTDFLYGLYPTAEDGVVDYMVDNLYPDPGIKRTMKILSDIGFVCNVNYLRKAFCGQTYNYKFRIPPAIHSSDMAYVFYNGPGPDEVDGGLYDGPLGPVIVEVALVLQQYVVNFIKYGDPNGPGLPLFPRADENTTMLTIDTDGMGVAAADTDNERCEWLQSVPYG
ncbi:carboxylesterase family protein [Candidatus Bathyarchaeota archaeon]|nr:carboxylesterase family protein [Candidatus Bathyarchaeota archaeon]